MYDAIARVMQKHFAIPHLAEDAKLSSHAVAVWRAAHQKLESPLIFPDPLALTILGDSEPDLLEKLDEHKDLLSSAMRLSIAVRSRFAEDEREAATENGVNQYVILGAGLDTYAYRSKRADEKVFEVDLPCTQAIKIKRLKQQNIQPTCAVHYVACDFEEGALEQQLISAGFNKNQKAFFSCLGVVAYLDVQAFEKTLRFIASCSPGSIFTFDYIVDPGSLSEIEQMVLNIMSAQLAAGGEPFKSFFNPLLLAQTLCEAGFSHLEDISPDYLNKRYLTSRNDGLRVGSATRMFIAIV